MQRSESEVVVIRRIPIIFVLLFVMLFLTPKAAAATLDSKAGAVTTKSGSLNVRSSPSSDATVVTSLKKGSYITLMEKSGAWWRVEYGKGKYGYCHADYITVVQGAPVTVVTNSGTLNIRSGPGTEYNKAGSLAKGECVIFLKESGGWSRVLYHGTKTGYVSARYLSNYFGPISLNVPGFKQNDSRWANQIVGMSGKTFAQIGCATTAIAMMESCRTGAVIYPDQMSNQLRYTASGDVYWPSHYKTVTSYSLKAVYQRLKEGKPVLFGAANKSGAQHWVVITGFEGATALLASDFTIEDPGTRSRTNLQQFLQEYPNFYKYFYY